MFVIEERFNLFGRWWQAEKIIGGAFEKSELSGMWRGLDLFGFQTGKDECVYRRDSIRRHGGSHRLLKRPPGGFLDRGPFGAAVDPLAENLHVGRCERRSRRHGESALM